MVSVNPGTGRHDQLICGISQGLPDPILVPEIYIVSPIPPLYRYFSGEGYCLHRAKGDACLFSPGTTLFIPGTGGSTQIAFLSVVFFKVPNRPPRSEGTCPNALLTADALLRIHRSNVSVSFVNVEGSEPACCQTFRILTLSALRDVYVIGKVFKGVLYNLYPRQE